MKNFHHGGRIGDCIYSLYTVKALGGGKMYLSDFQQGNWSLQIAKSLKPFLEYQDYIGEVEVVDQEQLKKLQIDYDLHKAELDYNPECFPEWHKRDWPGNCHIAKRYATHFGIPFFVENSWLKAPQTKRVDVAFHAPLRRAVRPPQDTGWIISQLTKQGYNVIILGSDDIDDWKPYADGGYLMPSSILEMADWINSAKVFMGAASSGNVIAEGLKKPRFVELADGCDNTFPYGMTGRFTNQYPKEELLEAIRLCLDRQVI